MSGFGRTKKSLPDPSTNTKPSTKQDYLSAMGLPPVEQPERLVTKKKKTRLDSGGQPSRLAQRMA